MKVIKESFNVSVEDIFKCINNVEEAYSEFESALTSLSYYVTTKYPKEGNYIENDSSSIQESVQELFDDIDNIKTILSKENHVEESMKVIKESKLKESQYRNSLYINLMDVMKWAAKYVSEQTGGQADITRVTNGLFTLHLVGDDAVYDRYAKLAYNESLKESKLNEEDGSK